MTMVLVCNAKSDMNRNKITILKITSIHYEIGTNEKETNRDRLYCVRLRNREST